MKRVLLRECEKLQLICVIGPTLRKTLGEYIWEKAEQNEAYERLDEEMKKPHFFNKLMHYKQFVLY